MIKTQTMEEVYSPRDQLKAWSGVWKVPNYIAPGIREIDYDKLVAMGVKHLVFDVDNTLVSFGADKLPPSTLAFLEQLKTHPGIESIRLASNSPRNMKEFNRELQVPIIQPRWGSFKPLPGFYLRVLRQVKSPANTVAMIGDKLVQDVWGANAVGMVTVLVQPIGRDNLLDTLILTRPRERRILRKYLPDNIQAWF